MRVLKAVVEEEDDQDYTVRVELPNGREITVILPKDPEDVDNPFGLNLVSNGHYY